MGRYFTIGFFVFLAVMLIVMSIPSFINWNQYKGTIESALSDASGYEVSVSGPVSFAVLPQPALTLTGVEAFAGDETPFLTLDNLAGRIALAPLLTGKVRVTTLKISGARLRTDATDLAARASNEAEAQTLRQPRGFEGFVVGLVQDVRVDSLEIEDFKVGSSDENAVPALVIDDGAVSFLSLNGPFTTESTVVVNGKRFRLTGELGEIRSDQSSAFVVRGFSGDGTEISIQGAAHDLRSAPTFSGALKLSGKGLAPVFDLLQVFGGAAKDKDAPAPISIDLPLVLSGDVSMTSQKVEASALAMQLGDSRAVMTLDLDRGEALTGAITLRATKLDGDSLIDTLALAAPSSDTRGDMQILLDLRSEGVTYRGKVLSNLAMTGALANGGFSLQDLDVTAPGATKVEFKKGAQREGVWTGELTAISQNARELATWLGMDVADVPRGRLALGQVRGQLNLDGEAVSLRDMVLDIDGAHYTGSFSKVGGSDASYGLTLRGQSLDLSDYRSDASLEGLAEMAGALNADFDLKIVSFTGAGLEGAALDTGLAVKGGAVEVKRLSVTTVQGETLTATGSLQNLAKDSLKGKLDWRLANWQSCRVVELIKLSEQLGCVPGDKASLSGHLSLNQGVGATSVKGTVGADNWDVKASGVQALWRDGGEISLKGNGSHGNYRATFDGVIKNVGTFPRFTFNGTLEAADGAGALGNLGYQLGGAQGPLKAEGAWEWSKDGFKAENIKASLGDLKASGSLTLVDDGATRKIDSKFELEGFDLSSLADNGFVIEDAEGRWSASNLEALLAEDLRGSVDVTLRNATFEDLKIPSAAIKGVISDSSSEWALYQGAFLDGAWTGKAIVTRKGKELRVEARGAGEGLDFASVTESFLGRKTLEGRGSLRFVLGGEGHSARAIIQSLKGTIDVESAEGRMLGFDLPGYALDLGEASGALGVRIANDEHLTHGASNYRDLLGRFEVEKGQALTSQWRAKTDVGGMYFGLDANFVQQNLGGRVEFNFEGIDNLPTFAIVLNGWGQELGGVWDTEAMQQIFEALLQAEQMAAEEVASEGTAEPTSTPATTSTGGAGREVESGDLAPLR
ncbi:MAG: AsmA family protein [Alphaproteobacteria bacterium]|nr:MAG: AsmA family protein [Alphaproteobacteria bacterium]